MKSILDSSFRYTPSAKTDLRKTFARIRRMAKAEAESLSKVQSIDQNKKITLINSVRQIS